MHRVDIFKFLEVLSCSGFCNEMVVRIIGLVMYLFRIVFGGCVQMKRWDGMGFLEVFSFLDLFVSLIIMMSPWLFLIFYMLMFFSVVVLSISRAVMVVLILFMVRISRPFKFLMMELSIIMA